MENKFYKKWWFWLIIILVLGVGYSISTSENSIFVDIDNTITSDSSKVVFLKGSNGKNFFKIVCDIINPENKYTNKLDESIMYEAYNLDYSIELETNKSNEVNYVRMMAMQTEEYTNFFLSASRLEYSNSNKTEAFNWINDNLGNEATTKIGDANFKLYNGTNGKPILEIYTDGNDDFQNEQIDK